jgi:hypothetical protein
VLDRGRDARGRWKRNGRRCSVGRRGAVWRGRRHVDRRWLGDRRRLSDRRRLGDRRWLGDRRRWRHDELDCGGTSNFCIGFSFGDFCGTDCSNTTCGSGQRCANIVDSSTQAVLGRNCVPVTGSTCASGTGGGGGTTGGGGGTTGGGGGATGGGGGTMCTTDTWATFGQAFFANNCANCHHHTGEFTTRTSVLNSKSSITSRISSGNMPQGATLPAATRSRILTYLGCNVP